MTAARLSHRRSLQKISEAFDVSMKPFKHSVSRKHFHRLSARQQRRITSEIRNTLRLNISHNSVTYEQSDNVALSNNINVASSSYINYSSWADEIPLSDIANNITDTNVDNNLSLNYDDSEDFTSSSLSTSFIEETFQDRFNVFC